MNEARCAVVIGATGTVGRGIVRQLAEAGWRVIAVGRDQARLDALKEQVAGVVAVAGSIGGDADGAALGTRIRAVAPTIHAVITSVNIPPVATRLLDVSGAGLAEVLHGNLLTHHVAARSFIPLLAAGGRYVGIGGGMADFTLAGAGPISLCQAAQRNMFRFFALETEARDITVVELMLFSHIVDPADEAAANPREIRADEVGQHLLAVLDRPEEFAGPILSLKSRKQVGLPEKQAS